MQIPINPDSEPWIIHCMTRPQPYPFSVVRKISESHWESLIHWPSYEVCKYATNEEAEAVRESIEHFRATTGLEFCSETSQYAGSEAIFMRRRASTGEA